MKYLLDTCTFLWLITNDPNLSNTARDLIQDTGNDVYLSAASCWEVAIKHSLGRLPMPQAPQKYIPRQRRDHYIAPLPIDEEATLHIGTLPDHHKDPFDRILVSQAIVGGLVILTPDPLIQRYPARWEW